MLGLVRLLHGAGCIAAPGPRYSWVDSLRPHSPLQWWGPKFVDLNPYMVGRGGPRLQCAWVMHASLPCGYRLCSAMPCRHATFTCSTCPCLFQTLLQESMPAANSVIDMLMRATNKDTGGGLTDVQIASAVSWGSSMLQHGGHLPFEGVRLCHGTACRSACVLCDGHRLATMLCLHDPLHCLFVPCACAPGSATR